MWPLDSYLTFLRFSFLISQTGIIPGLQHRVGVGWKKLQSSVPMGQHHFPLPDFAVIRSGSPPGVGESSLIWEVPLLSTVAHRRISVGPAHMGICHLPISLRDYLLGRACREHTANQDWCEVVISPCPQSYKSHQSDSCLVLSLGWETELQGMPLTWHSVVLSTWGARSWSRKQVVVDNWRGRGYAEK